MLKYLIDNIFAMFGGRVLRYEAWSIPICICGIIYVKLDGIDAINEITKPRII
jgi:hypothetical protein